MESTLEESKIPLSNTHKTSPRVIKELKGIRELSELLKTKAHPRTNEDKFHNILEGKESSIFIAELN